MKAVLSTDSLSLGLRRVLNVVSTRTTLPVLNNVLINAADDALTLTTTDLEVSIRTTVPAEVEEPGEITLPVRKFSQIVGVLPGGPVKLSSDDSQQTSLACQKSFFRIVGVDATEFPRDGDFDEDWSFRMTANDLRKSLGKVSYSSSSDETRHMLNGILVSLRGGILTIAATDGRRLALVEKSIEGEGPADGDVILPPKVVAEITRIFEGDDEVHVRLCKSRAAFSVAHTLITTKLVEGTYPNYRQVIPASFSRSVTIPREEFATVLNRVSMVVSESSASVKMSLENAVMTVSASSQEFGESAEPLDVSYEGDPIEIAFNPGFFIDPLRHLECDQLILQFNDQYSPVSMCGDEGFLYVVMPMRA